MIPVHVEEMERWWFGLDSILRTVYADLGNGQLKMALGNGKTVNVRHRMAFLRPDEYKTILDRYSGRPGPFLLRITPPEGKPQCILIGDEASSANEVARPEGAARYVREYFGFMFIAMVARMLPFSAELHAFVAHAPRDFAYRKNQRQAIRGEWIVEIGKEKRVYVVKKVFNFDEPMGGWANQALNRDGSKNTNSPLYNGTVLGLDIGYHTTDLVVVNPGGVLDPMLIDSAPIGIGQVVSDFKSLFKSKHAAILQAGGNLTDNQVYNAIRFGEFEYNGYTYDCSDEVRPGMTRLTNTVRDYVRQYTGGFGRFGYAFLTGGGGWMSHPYLLENMDGFNPERVFLAVNPKKPELMPVANALGAIPLWNIGVSSGAVR
jgi:hypothetical protein